MSVSDKEISSAGGDVVVNGTGEAEEGGRLQRRKKKRLFGFGELFNKGKSFRKIFKRRSISSTEKIFPRCLFCIGRPKTMELAIDSPTGDPNDPMFTHEMVRVFLERNDFYSKECNPHLDIGNLRLS